MTLNKIGCSVMIRIIKQNEKELYQWAGLIPRYPLGLLYIHILCYSINNIPFFYKSQSFLGVYLNGKRSKQSSLKSNEKS